MLLTDHVVSQHRQQVREYRHSLERVNSGAFGDREASAADLIRRIAELESLLADARC